MSDAGVLAHDRLRPASLPTFDREKDAAMLVLRHRQDVVRFA
jgi:hypothetical protein